MDKEKDKRAHRHDKPKGKTKKEKNLDLDKVCGTKTKKKCRLFEKIRATLAAMPARKRKIVLTLVSIVGVLVILLCTALGYGCYIYCGIRSAYNYNDSVDGDEELNSIIPIEEGVMNMALFGIDSRTVGSFKGLSDSLMVLSLNTKTGQVKLISVMRDSFVEIPGYNPGKVNSAYSLGGPALAIKTLNKNFGLDIKEYATVNFYGMAEIVDAVGGIEVDVRQEEINHSKGLNNNIREQCGYMGVNANDYLVKQPGLQKLNGVQAVAWARIRAVSTDVSGQSNDYGRTDRQRYVLEQLLNEVKDLDLTTMINLAKEIVKYMETSLHLEKELIPLIAKMFTKEISFTQTRVPQSEYVISDKYSYAGSGWSVYYNRDFAADIIHSFIYKNVTQESYLEANGIIKEGWHSVGGGSGSGSNNNYTPNYNSNNNQGAISSNQSSSNKTSSNQVSSNQNSSGQISSNQASSNQNSSNQNSSGQISSGQNSSDLTSSNQTSSNLTSSNQTSSNISSSDVVSSGNTSSENNDFDEPSNEISSEVVSDEDPEIDNPEVDEDVEEDPEMTIPGEDSSGNEAPENSESESGSSTESAPNEQPTLPDIGENEG